MRIVKGIQNTISLRLQANASTPNPEWLFRLTNEFTGEVKVFRADDISDYTEAYNLFRITEGGTENLYTGNINLNTSGQWTCEVFEMEQSTPPSLNPDEALKTVLIEVCHVYDGSENQINNFEEDEEKNTPVFDVE